jgi:hypothetical protein
MSTEAEKIRDRIVSQVRAVEAPSRDDLNACLDDPELDSEVTVKLNLAELLTFKELKHIRREHRENDLPDEPQYLPLAKDCDIATALLTGRVKSQNLYPDDLKYLTDNPSIAEILAERLSPADAEWMNGLLDYSRREIESNGFIMGATREVAAE